MKKIIFKKIKIAKLSDDEKRLINGGNAMEGSKVPPCTIFTIDFIKEDSSVNC